MDIITIDSKAYQHLIDKIDKIYKLVEKTNNDKSDPIINKEWITTQDAIKLMNVSKRTLQRMRTERLITFSRFKGKCLYRRSDIIGLIDSMTIPANIQNDSDFMDRHKRDLSCDNELDLEFDEESDLSFDCDQEQ